MPGPHVVIRSEHADRTGSLGVPPDVALANLNRFNRDHISSARKRKANQPPLKPAPPPEDAPQPEYTRAIREERKAELVQQKRARAVASRAKMLAAFKMLMGGADVAAIAKELNVTLAFVRAAIGTMLDSLAPTENQRTRLRTLWLERMESLVAPFYTNAAAGDPDALDSLLKLADRIAKFVDAGDSKHQGGALAQVVIRLDPTSGLISPGRDDQELAARSSLTMIQAGPTLPRAVQPMPRQGGAWADLLTASTEVETLPCLADPRADDEEADGEPGAGSSDAGRPPPREDQ